jgi:hypothetical protein
MHYGDGKDSSLSRKSVRWPMEEMMEVRLLVIRCLDEHRATLTTTTEDR